MGIICDGRCPNNMGSGAIVNYHRHKFENIDQHEHAVIVVAPELLCNLTNFIWEIKVVENPPAPSRCGARQCGSKTLNLLPF
jgi:hypothetical protein